MGITSMIPATIPMPKAVNKSFIIQLFRI
jgi:hypothetical protein